jgi:hypothetical protein
MLGTMVSTEYNLRVALTGVREREREREKGLLHARVLLNICIGTTI